MSRTSVVVRRDWSPTVLVLIAAVLAAVAGPNFLAGVLAAHDAPFLYSIFALAIVLLFLAAAWAAHAGHSRWAAVLSAAAGTPTVGFVLATYGYGQVHSLDGHPFGRAETLLAAALYLGCIGLCTVLVPRKLGAGVDLVLSTMFAVATLLIVAFWFLIVLTGGPGGE